MSDEVEERVPLSVYKLPGGGWGASCCGGKHKFESRNANEAQATCEVIHLRDALDTALEALREIAEHWCENNDTGDEPECPDLGVKPPCPSCRARSTLTQLDPTQEER